MINVPNLSWINTPNGLGPVAQAAANFVTDTTYRVNLSGGILGKNVIPQVFSVDNLSNSEQVTLTFNGVSTVVPANVRQLFTVPPGTNQLDAVCTGAARTAATIVFYADSRDAPPEQPNYAGLITRAVAAALIPGFTMWWPGPVVPSASDWLVMDGASYTTIAQPNLFAALGYTWGGAGANFNVPDARDSVLIGASTGGLTSNRPSVRVIGTRGGEETHTVTNPESALHQHGIPWTAPMSTVFGTFNGVNTDGNGGGATSTIYNTPNTVNASGGGGAANVMQPFIVGTWLIHT